MPATVTVSVAGRSYEIGCDDGQEERVRALAADIDRRVNDLLKSVGAVGEARLLFMAALLIADELSGIKSALDARTPRGGRSRCRCGRRGDGLGAPS